MRRRFMRMGVWWSCWRGERRRSCRVRAGRWLRSGRRREWRRKNLVVMFLSPLRGWVDARTVTHGLRRGLHSFAASRLVFNSLDTSLFGSLFQFIPRFHCLRLPFNFFAASLLGGCLSIFSLRGNLSIPGYWLSVFGCGSRFFAGSFASKTRLKKPTIISSQFCWPQMTVFVGSGFSGLLGELSKCAVHSIFVPLGRVMGSGRLYQSCQCQL